MSIFGDPRFESFSVKIEEEDTVEELQVLLCSKFANMFRDIDPYDLELWKIIDPIHAYNLKEKLPERYGAIESVATLMKRAIVLKNIFKSLPREHIHVIVWRPTRPLPDMNRNDVLSSSSHQVSGLPLNTTKNAEASYTGAGGSHISNQSSAQGLISQNFAETRGVTAPMMMETLSEQTRDKIDAIHQAIRSFSTNHNLADPKTFIDIPFPSPLPPPTRFHLSKVNDLDHFKYMGRLQFAELEKFAECGYFNERRSNISLDGCSGIGKSHLLAVLALRLIQDGKRVIYIPDCRPLVHSFAETLRAALCFAFHDDPTAYEAIVSAPGVDGLLRFSRKTKDKYIIIDQLNTLDTNRDDPLQASKLRISFNGGMNEGETKQWFKHYARQLPSLTLQDKNLIMYLTGSVPLLLRAVFRFKKSGFDEHKFMECRDVLVIRRGVTQLFHGKMEELGLRPNEKERFLEGMEACLRNGRVSSTETLMFDSRYFYIRNEIGYCTCGVVTKALMPLLRSRRFNCMDYRLWYDSLRESKNPIVKGFIAEQICLYKISISGLRAVDPDLSAMDMVNFAGRPRWENQIQDIQRCRLHIPKDYNFPDIDAIILLIDTDSCHVYAYPIQITLNRAHKNSQKRFYKNTWPSWKRILKGQGFTASSIFVWIVADKPTDKYKRSFHLPKIAPFVGKKHVDQETETYVSIFDVDESLSECLNRT
ncbi:hypothetical protein CPB86DRAFT_803090 [Serendipita vermifera]|nr:hypothetical protein CPB86DRAFT_803090 [Serendipita vermifera]